MYSKMQSRGGYFGNEPVALDAFAGNDDHLAVLDLAHELSADDVERAGLRRKHPSLAEVAEHQRADAVGVARADRASCW